MRLASLTLLNALKSEIYLSGHENNRGRFMCYFSNTMLLPFSIFIILRDVQNFYNIGLQRCHYQRSQELIARIECIIILYNFLWIR